MSFTVSRNNGNIYIYKFNLHGWWCEVKHCRNHCNGEHLVRLHKKHNKKKELVQLRHHQENTGFQYKHTWLHLIEIYCLFIIFFLWSVTKCSLL
jgi:hypothetical protein